MHINQMEDQKWWQWLNRRTILGIRLPMVLLVLSMYLLFNFIYHLTLWINGTGYKRSDFPLFDLDIFTHTGLSYLVMFVLTIPIWWVIFRLMRSFPLNWRLLIHVVTLPVFAISSKFLTYAIKDYVGIFRLDGPAEVWDLYIPGLLYLVQFGLFHAYEYYSESREKERRTALLREAALKSELAAIKAQLNPHFLYNVFNTINASLPPESESTREMIAHLSDLFRYQLQASQVESIPLKEEIAFLNKYLLLEKARFKDRLRVHIDIPQDLLEEEVPPMILQPLVENSIKHGISSLIEGGEIFISAKKQEEGIYFEVKDTGIGAPNTQELIGVGIGLTNTHLRLKKGYNSGLSIQNNVPRGLTVAFML